MEKILHVVAILGIIINLFSCKSENKGSRTEESFMENGKEVTAGPETFESAFDSSTNSIPIFYNMYLTVEMASLFESVEVGFNDEIINSPDNLSNYLTSSKKALNIGVYAVDLSYSKVYEQYELSSSYFSAMHKLSEQLGIPDEKFYDAASRFERNIANKDSLAMIAHEVYMTTDEYLKENNRDNAASLIVVGGWIEALNIATHVFYDGGKDTEILDRIKEQVYSLNDLLSLLEDLRSNEVVNEYYKKLESLKPYFKEIEIDYNNPEVGYEAMERLTKKIREMRGEIVS